MKTIGMVAITLYQYKYDMLYKLCKQSNQLTQYLLEQLYI